MATNLKAKYSDVLIKPRVTEKASYVLEKNVYTFLIEETANKKQVAEAIRAYYKVVPEKINIVRNPSKNVFMRGKRGVKQGVKKAYVYLKSGDKIE